MWSLTHTSENPRSSACCAARATASPLATRPYCGRWTPYVMAMQSSMPQDVGVPVVVRIAGEPDVDRLAALRRRWNEERRDGPIDDAGFEASFRDWWEAEHPTRTFFLAELEDEPVGMAN